MNLLPSTSSAQQRACWDRLWRVLLTPADMIGEQREAPSEAGTLGAGRRDDGGLRDDAIPKT